VFSGRLKAIRKVVATMARRISRAVRMEDWLERSWHNVGDRYFVGVDLGGTTGAKVALFNASGKLIACIVVGIDRLRSHGGFQRRFRRQVDSDLLKPRSISRKQIAVVVFAAAGTLFPIDEKDPRQIDGIEFSPNMSLMTQINLREMCGAVFPWAFAAVENDANAHAWAEYMFGIGNSKAYRDIKDKLFMVHAAFGTGFGTAGILEGKMLRPFEMGHACQGWPSPRGDCGCGHPDCIECSISAAGIRAEALNRMARGQASSLTKLTVDHINPRTVAEAARRGDPLARSVYCEFGLRFGRWIVRTVAPAVVPDVVTCSGQIARDFELMIPGVEDAFAEDLDRLLRRQVDFGNHAPMTGHVVVRATSLDMGMIGALGAGGQAKLIWDERAKA